jgi:pimeloyl-ACP methyl ester carboxylesterase
MRLVLLHALPLDGRMWDATGTRFGGAFAPTLYGLGESVRDWAVAVLEHCGGDELLVVGNSVGGSCALEVARAAPGQVRGVVLVGAKAGVRRDPRARDEAVRLLRQDGVEAAWDRYWVPLFGAQAEPEVVSTARKVALEQDVADLMTGVRAFYDRRDHAEFLGSWSGAGPAGVKPQNGRLLAAGAS